jgi:hypothetical protein
VKHKSLYLYLALACFLGIVLIFVFDGYMGTYDRLEIITGEYTQTIEPEDWPEEVGFRYIGVESDDIINFTYELDNRSFSGYSSGFEVSLWREGEKIKDILTESISIGAFDDWSIDWMLDTGEILPPGTSPQQNLQFTVLIKRGDIERNVVVSVHKIVVIPSSA